MIKKTNYEKLLDRENRNIQQGYYWSERKPEYTYHDVMDGCPNCKLHDTCEWWKLYHETISKMD